MGRTFYCPHFRRFAVLAEIALRRAVGLDGAEYAVMVGDDQPVRRHERRRAPAKQDHRSEGIAGDVREPRRIDADAHFLQLGSELRDLLGHPHPLPRVGAEGDEYR